MVRNGLYIKDQKVDVDDNQLFLFTYSNNDVVNPEAVKNSYTKTITIKGTPNNNQVFNNLWRLDQSYERYGLGFKQWNREPFELYDNGNLLESGYVQVNSIKYQKNNPSYEITLYGMLGDFFYKLMYDEETGNELTLADLYYGYSKLDTTLGEADEHNRPTQNVSEHITPAVDNYKDSRLFLWDKNFIYNSWLLQFTDIYPQTDQMLWEQFITAAPAYNGMHDDFDNDVVLTNMNYPSAYNDILPRSQRIEGQDYTVKHDYSRLKAQREFDEWEVRDLRSIYQRPAIRLGPLFNKISDYSKMQGYEIVWDKDIDVTGSKQIGESSLNDYYWRSYIMLNPLNFEAEETTYFNLDATDLEYKTKDGWKEVYLKNPVDGSTTFNLSQEDNLQLSIAVNERWTCPSRQSDVNGGKIVYTSAYRKDGEWFSYNRLSIFGAFVYLVEVYDGDERVNKQLFFVENATTEPNFGDKYENFRVAIMRWCDKNIGEPIGFDNWQIFSPNAINAKTPDSDEHFCTFENNIVLPIYELPKSRNVKIKVRKHFCSLIYNQYNNGWYWEWKWDTVKTSEPNYQQLVVDTNGTAVKNYSNSKWYGSLADFRSLQLVDENNTIIYTPSNSTLRPITVTKNILFANTNSPFAYLVDWCKLFNLRFRTDILKKRIHIEQRKNYFVDEVINLNDKIDYSKDFILDPVYVEDRIYQFTLENEESYAHYIYNKVNNQDYSTKKLDTWYEFNNEVKDVFENNIYNVNIDYMLKSPYFNTTMGKDNIQYPTTVLMPSYDYYLWHGDETKETKMFGLQSFYTLPTKEDNFTKQCLFDKEDKSLDIDNSLVLFDRLWIMPQQSSNTEYRPYMLTDNLEIMQDLNDDNPCYLNAWYDNSITPYNQYTYWVKREQQGVINNGGQVGVIGLYTFMLPMMNSSCRNFNDNMYAHSYYCSTPSSTDSYYGNITWGGESGLFNKFWLRYIGDVIDWDTKELECYVLLDSMPREALRKFYFINNTIWSLEEISDYNYKGNQPTKCKFIKVQNRDAYLK